MRRATLAAAAALLVLLAAAGCGNGGEPADGNGAAQAQQQQIIWPTDTPEPEEAEEPAPSPEAAEMPTETPEGEPEPAPGTTPAGEDAGTQDPARPEDRIPTVTPAPLMVPTITPLPLMIPTITPAGAGRATPAATPSADTTAAPSATPRPTPTDSPGMARAKEMAAAAGTMMAGGDYQGALTALEEAEQALGRRPHWISGPTAEAMAGLGRDEEALSLYTHAIEEGPSNGEYLVKRARLHLRRNDPEAGGRDALRAYRTEPVEWEVFRGAHRYDSRAEAGRILTKLHLISQDYGEAHRHANAALTAAIRAGYPEEVLAELRERRDWLQTVLRIRGQRGGPDDEQ